MRSKQPLNRNTHASVEPMYLLELNQSQPEADTYSKRYSGWESRGHWEVVSVLNQAQRISSLLCLLPGCRPPPSSPEVKQAFDFHWGSSALPWALMSKPLGSTWPEHLLAHQLNSKLGSQWPLWPSFPSPHLLGIPSCSSPPTHPTTPLPPALTSSTRTENRQHIWTDTSLVDSTQCWVPSGCLVLSTLGLALLITDRS